MRAPQVVIAVLALGALAAPAPAEPSADDGITGFTTYGSGELSGVVAAADGKPLAGVTVHIVPAAGAPQQVVTDSQGRYHAVVKDGGAYAMVFVKGRVRLGGQIS